MYTKGVVMVSTHPYIQCIKKGQKFAPVVKLAKLNFTYTANVMTIKIMDFDHVPNPGIMSP